MTGNHLTRDMVFVSNEDSKQYIDADKSYLNATLPPTDPNADTEWSYLTADGSDDMDFADAF